jgi:ATP-dependent RNA helicase DeaD
MTWALLNFTHTGRSDTRNYRRRKGHDGLAPTGTGKTLAFGLPLIQLIDFNKKDTQGVVICPTRELCSQIYDDFEKLCKYIKGARIASVYGGASIENQIKTIRKGAQIIVATPGGCWI